MESVKPINLLPQSAKQFQVRSKRFRSVQLVLIGLCVVLGVVTVGVWGVVFVTSGRILEEEKMIASLQQRVVGMAKREQQFVLLANRLEQSKLSLDQRADLETRLNRVLVALPDSVVATSVTVSDDAQAVTLVATSSTFDGFASLLSILSGGGFRSVTVTNLSRDEAGLYGVSLMISIQ